MIITTTTTNNNNYIISIISIICITIRRPDAASHRRVRRQGSAPAKRVPRLRQL